MNQELDSEQIFERLDDMLRKGERKRRGAIEPPPYRNGGAKIAALDEQEFEEVPRLLLTQAMMVPSASVNDALMALQHINLDDSQVEELVARIYTDINARIEASLPQWIDESLQKRVLEMTGTSRDNDASLSH